MSFRSSPARALIAQRMPTKQSRVTKVTPAIAHFPLRAEETSAATSQISYTASKGAVLSLSRELAVQFARQGIRVNALCPGPVETPLLLRIFGDDPAAYERRRVHLPMGRLAKPREIVNAALFLASDESSYVTGATFMVDGGLTAAYVTPE